MSELRISYNVIGNGFRVGSEGIWIDCNDFYNDMSDSTIAGLIDEIVTEDFNQRYQPETLNLEDIIEQIKQHLQGEDNELA